MKNRFGVAMALYKKAGTDGGWTVRLSDLSVPETGHCVGGNPAVPTWLVPSWRNMPGPFVVQQIASHLEVLDNAGAEYTGGWVDDDGTLWLDDVTVLTDHDAAVALGRERGEQAIFNLHTGEETVL